MAFVGCGQNKYTVFPLENYTFGNKKAQKEKEHTVEARFARMRQRYEQEGMRRTVDAVLLIHKHNTLHVLILQVGSAFFKLPGGRLKVTEDEIAGLKRKLTNKLAPEKMEEFAMQWQVGDCLGKFYRPNFETLMYPYCPPHIARPKEMKKLFIVPLPERAFFSVPRNMKLVAVPLFEIHDHSHRYGPVIASIPSLLSRLNFNLHGVDASIVRQPVPPPLQEQQPPQQQNSQTLQ